MLPTGGWLMLRGTFRLGLHALAQFDLTTKDRQIQLAAAQLTAQAGPAVGGKILESFDSLPADSQAALLVAWMFTHVVHGQVLRAELGYAGATGLLALSLALLYRRGTAERVASP